jgi:hypothetical protein
MFMYPRIQNHPVRHERLATTLLNIADANACQHGDPNIREPRFEYELARECQSRTIAFEINL